MENSTSEATLQADKTKRSIVRSAAYPAISLSEALTFVSEVYKNFTAAQFISREDVAAVLKRSPATIQRDVAAAAQYKFFDKAKQGYQISEPYKTIHNFLSEKEKKKCLLEAFGSPKLYADLIAKHDGHALPLELKTHLIRFHQIAENAAAAAAELFVENARFVGALSDNGILNYKKELEKLSDNGVQYAEIITEEPPKKEDKVFDFHQKTDLLPPGNTGQQGLPNIPNAENVKIPLTGKQVAYLIYPVKITKTDIAILRKQIDILELSAE